MLGGKGNKAESAALDVVLKTVLHASSLKAGTL